MVFLSLIVINVRIEKPSGIPEGFSYGFALPFYPNRSQEKIN
jgi:hypothetical protein